MKKRVTFTIPQANRAQRKQRSIRWSDDEVFIIRAAAEEMGTDLSKFVRACALSAAKEVLVLKTKEGHRADDGE